MYSTVQPLYVLLMEHEALLIALVHEAFFMAAFSIKLQFLKEKNKVYMLVNDGSSSWCTIE